MKVLLINPPYQTLTSNVGVGHQVPLGLLMVGGALIDTGNDVTLLDAEARRLSIGRVVDEVCRRSPDIVMTGHAGSTPAHPLCLRMLRAIKAACPRVVSVYGGVYPTYHALQILESEPGVDVVVRGEGEETSAALAAAMADPRCDLTEIAGITYRDRSGIFNNPDRPPIRDLDGCRVAWELVDNWDRYQCFGLGRAAIVQFSRGCPHRCTYCGQHGFWVSWRHRDPLRLADEIEWLHRTHDVRFVTLADENPTTSQRQWLRFLRALAHKRLPVHCFVTLRATDVVRDRTFLQLYREAGLLYTLLGIDATDDATLQRVNKRSTGAHDRLACRLLKRHGIFSIMGHIVGLGNESWQSLARSLGRLCAYDGDLLNVMYATPHDWTPFGRASALRPVVEPNLTNWDYRHQVLGEPRLRPWQLFASVKFMELWFHLRPIRLRSIFLMRDRFRQRQMLWCALHTGLVWLGEIAQFIVRGVARRDRTMVVRSKTTALPASRRLPLPVMS